MDKTLTANELLLMREILAAVISRVNIGGSRLPETEKLIDKIAELHDYLTIHKRDGFELCPYSGLGDSRQSGGSGSDEWSAPTSTDG